MWPTPRAQTGGAESAERKQELGRTESGGGCLESVATSLSSLPDPATSPDGVASSPPTPTSPPPSAGKKRRLSPEFVTWLQGIPPAWTSCERSGIPFAQFREPSPCESSSPPSSVPTPNQSHNSEVSSASKQWPTPTTQDSEQAGSVAAGHVTLNRTAVEMWKTHAPRLKKDRQTRDPATQGNYRADLKDQILAFPEDLLETAGSAADSRPPAWNDTFDGWQARMRRELERLLALHGIESYTETRSCPPTR